MMSRVDAVRIPEPPLPSEELPKPDARNRGSSIPSAWNGAPIHPSIAVASLMLDAVEANTLLAAPAAAPAAEYPGAPGVSAWPDALLSVR